jgi:hypothetical protein
MPSSCCYSTQFSAVQSGSWPPPAEKSKEILDKGIADRSTKGKKRGNQGGKNFSRARRQRAGEPWRKDRSDAPGALPPWKILFFSPELI